MRSIDHEELNINHAENPDDLFWSYFLIISPNN
jgi:hypothetical protein